MPDGRKDEGLDRWAEGGSLIAHSSKSKTTQDKLHKVNHPVFSAIIYTFTSFISNTKVSMQLQFSII